MLGFFLLPLPTPQDYFTPKLEFIFIKIHNKFSIDINTYLIVKVNTGHGKVHMEGLIS